MTAPLYYTYPFAISSSYKTTVPPQTQSNGQISYQQGWTNNYQLNLAVPDSGALPISLNQTNQLFYDATSNIQQYQQQGTPNWYAADANSMPIPYPVYARVLYTDGNIWENQVASNTTTPSYANGWIVVSGSSGQNQLTGSIIDYAGTSVPNGYLNCDGSSYLVADYPALYAAIGYTWGGSGANFSVPNLQRSVTIGSGGTVVNSIIGNVVGNTGGEEQHLMTTDELVAHTHTINVWGASGSSSPAKPSQVLGGTATTNTSNQNTTTGNAFNIIQPSAVVMKLIKT